MDNFNLENIKRDFDRELSQAQSEKDLFELKGKYIGKKRGIISELLEKIPSLPQEERKTFGKEINILKNYLEKKISESFENIEKMKSSLPKMDLTLPGRNVFSGKVHPLSQIKEEIEDIFVSMGYTIATGPEIEDSYHNFEALNTPEDHPSRDIQDTFYLDVENLLLRTQTSPVQVRSMEKKKPPIKLIAPGRVFRRDDDVSHSPMFFQVEGLVVDENITMADLKGTLLDFYRKLFRKDVSIRFRASYFPFTEPSAETDLSCVICNGSGCNVCKRTGWLEVGGCGMVDPKVFEFVGIDPEKYSGFAFGLGIDRITMIKYGIDNIKYFLENDIRFLEQF